MGVGLGFLVGNGYGQDLLDLAAQGGDEFEEFRVQIRAKELHKG